MNILFFSRIDLFQVSKLPLGSLSKSSVKDCSLARVCVRACSAVRMCVCLIHLCVCSAVTDIWLNSDWYWPGAFRCPCVALCTGQHTRLQRTSARAHSATSQPALSHSAAAAAAGWGRRSRAGAEGLRGAFTIVDTFSFSPISPLQALLTRGLTNRYVARQRRHRRRRHLDVAVTSLIPLCTPTVRRALMAW